MQKKKKKLFHHRKQTKSTMPASKHARPEHVLWTLQILMGRLCARGLTGGLTGGRYAPLPNRMFEHIRLEGLQVSATLVISTLAILIAGREELVGA